MMATMADDVELQPEDASLRADWKTKYAQARVVREKMQREIADARRATSFAKHEILEPATLQRLFPHRFRTLYSRTRAQDSAARERAFRATCAAYSRSEQHASRIERHKVDGLHWHVPALTRKLDELPGWFEKEQRFPYAAILQTRDVSIGGVMLDIGANVGRVSIPRVVLGDVTAAYCAEPDSLNYECLRRNVLDNGLAGLVMPDCVAITDRDGAVTLRQGKKYTGHRVVTEPNPAGDVIDVPACTLDTWVRRHNIDLDAVTFVKVDVEGHEQRVLDGAAEVLTRAHIAWQLEVWSAQLSAVGNSAMQLAASLARHFTHFVDLRREIPDPRVRLIAELHDMASELDKVGGKTDIVVFTSGE
jgi:FkbM family methyltransferase